MLGTDTADLLDLLPDAAAEGLAGEVAPRSGAWPADAGDLLHRVVTTHPDADGRRSAARALGTLSPSVAVAAAAAAFDLVPWPDIGAVSVALADPVAASRHVAPLGDRVLGAASAAAGSAGRPDVVWLFALAPRPVPFYVRMGDALAADPQGEGRLAAMIRAFRDDLADPATAGRTDGAAAAAQLLHRVPALTVGRDTVDSLVDLLVAARRRGTPARHVVDAAVGLLARLERAPADPEPADPEPAENESLVARSRQRQARIDGTRAAVALLAELQAYPPVARDPRGIWDDLTTIAGEYGLAAIGVRGADEPYQPHLHEWLDDESDDGADDGADSGAGDGRDATEDDGGEGGASPDRTVRVVRSGYTWAHGGEVVVLQRALVRSAEPD